MRYIFSSYLLFVCLFFLLFASNDWGIILLFICSVNWGNGISLAKDMAYTMKDTCSPCLSRNNLIYGPRKIYGEEYGYVWAPLLLFAHINWFFKTRNLQIFLIFFLWHFLQMTVAEAREVCQHWWMKEALDILVQRIVSSQQRKEDLYSIGWFSKF